MGTGGKFRAYERGRSLATCGTTWRQQQVFFLFTLRAEVVFVVASFEHRRALEPLLCYDLITVVD